MFSGIGSSLVGGALGIFGAGRANKESAASAQQSIDFQRESMQNRYQWMYDDLKKAGINPMLAYAKQSTGASGAQYQAQNVGEAGVRGASSAAQTSFMAREQKNRDQIADSQIALNSARAMKEQADAKVKMSQVSSDLYGKQAALHTQSAKESESRIGLLQNQKWKVSSEIAHLQKQIDLTEQKVDESRSSAERNRASAQLQKQQMGLSEAIQRQTEIDSHLKALQVPGAETKARHDKSAFGRYLQEWIGHPARDVLPFWKGVK